MGFKAKLVRVENEFDVYVVEKKNTGEKRYFKLYECGKIEDVKYPHAIVAEAVKKTIRRTKS